MSNAPAAQTAETEPEIPDEVARRKRVALTPVAAEEQGTVTREGATDYGASKSINAGLAAYNASRGSAGKTQNVRKAVEKFIFDTFKGEPLKGLNMAQVDEIRGRNYPKAPKMDATIGDMTPAFVNWLYANEPKDAAIRYAYRDILPTVLPAAWPYESIAKQTRTKKPTTV
jgi:hypothetical protein